MNTIPSCTLYNESTGVLTMNTEGYLQERLTRFALAFFSDSWDWKLPGMQLYSEKLDSVTLLVVEDLIWLINNMIDCFALLLNRRGKYRAVDFIHREEPDGSQGIERKEKMKSGEVTNCFTLIRPATYWYFNLKGSVEFSSG